MLLVANSEGGVSNFPRTKTSPSQGSHGTSAQMYLRAAVTRRRAVAHGGTHPSRAVACRGFMLYQRKTSKKQAAAEGKLLTHNSTLLWSIKVLKSKTRTGSYLWICRSMKMNKVIIHPASRHHAILMRYSSFVMTQEVANFCSTASILY